MSHWNGLSRIVRRHEIYLVKGTCHVCHVKLQFFHFTEVLYSVSSEIVAWYQNCKLLLTLGRKLYRQCWLLQFDQAKKVRRKDHEKYIKYNSDQLKCLYDCISYSIFSFFPNILELGQTKNNSWNLEINCCFYCIYSKSDNIGK